MTLQSRLSSLLYYWLQFLCAFLGAAAFFFGFASSVMAWSTLPALTSALAAFAAAAMSGLPAAPVFTNSPQVRLSLSSFCALARSMA
jgi:hypothetical protein